MKPYLLVLAAFVFLASLAVAPDVYAQFGGSRGGGMAGMGGGARQGERERGKGCAGNEKADAGKATPGPQPQPMGREQLEYQLGTLQVDLHLAPEQAPLWQAFADRVLALEADQARQRNRSVSAAAMAPVAASASAIKPIATAVDTTRNRLTALEDIESAGRALYQTLQPQQKTLADLRMATFLAPLLGS